MAKKINNSIRLNAPKDFSTSEPLSIPGKPEEGSAREPFYLSNRTSIVGRPYSFEKDPEQVSSSITDKLIANFAIDNPVGSLINGMFVLSTLPDEDIDPTIPNDFNPMADITGYEDYKDRFALADSPFEVQFLKSKIDKQREYRKVQAEGGVVNFVSGLAAGIIDPLILLPVGGAAKITYKAGESILKGAAVTGRGAILGSSVSEMALLANQETRTYGEAAANIAGSALLGSALGGSIGAYAAFKGNKNALKLLSDSVEKDMILPPEGKDLLGGDGVAITEADLLNDSNIFKSAGAAAVNKTAAKLASALGMENVSFFGLLKASPTLRLATSESIEARRGVMDIADTGLRYEHNNLGIATPTPAKTIIDHLYQKSMTNVQTTINDNFTKYKAREGHLPVEQRTRITDAYGVMSKTNYLNSDEFNVEISKALRRGDKHDVSEVQSAARDIRKELNYYRDLSIDAGLLSEKYKVDDSNYLHRLYDKNQISARRGEFKEIVMDWLRGDKELALDNNELNQAGDQVINHILGIADGRTPYQGVSLNVGVRGPLKERSFNIPDRLIEDFLVNDIGIVMDRYVRTMSADITLKNKIGDLNGEGFVSKIRDEYQDKINQLLIANPKAAERTKQLLADLEKKYQDDIKVAPEESKASITEKYQTERSFIEDATPEEVLSRRENLKLVEDRLIGDIKKIKESAWKAEVKRIESEYKKTTDKLINRTAVDLSALKRARIARTKKLATLENNRKNGLEPPITPGIQKRLDKAQDNFEISTKSLLEAKTLKQKGREKIETARSNALSEVKASDPNASIRRNEINSKYDNALTQIMRPQKDAIKMIKKLEKSRESDINDIQTLVSIMRGNSLINSTSAVNAYQIPKIINTAKSWNFSRSLGQSLFSYMSDLGGFVFVHGFSRTIGDLVIPFIKNINTVFKPILKKGEISDSLWRQRRAEIRELGIASEVLLQTRIKSLSEVGGDYAVGGLEKFNRFISKKTAYYSGSLHWTEMAKTSASILAQSKIIRTALSTNRTSKEIASMAQYGLDARSLDVIADQFKKFGKSGDGIMIAGTDGWSKRAAATDFELAVRRIVDNTVLTPDLEKPLFFHTPVGSLLGQFKSFGIAAYQRFFLAGLQRRDLESMNGAITMVTLGMFSLAMKDLFNYGEVKERSQGEWLKLGVERSGLTGHLMDIENMMDKITGGNVGINRLIGEQPKSRDYIAQALKSISPTLGLGADIFETGTGTLGALTSDETLRGKTLSAGRRLVPFQNSLLFTKAFDFGEDWLRGTLGVRPRGEFNKKKSG